MQVVVKLEESMRDQLRRRSALHLKERTVLIMAFAKVGGPWCRDAPIDCAWPSFDKICNDLLGLGQHLHPRPLLALFAAAREAAQ